MFFPHLLFVKQCGNVTVVMARPQILIKICAVRAIELQINLGKHESLYCVRASIKIPFVICYFIRPIIISANLRCVPRRVGFAGAFVKLNYTLCRYTRTPASVILCVLSREEL